MRLRVASYNIHRAIGRDGRYEPGRILRVAQELNADIIALQEVDFPRQDNAPMARWMSSSQSAAERFTCSIPTWDCGRANGRSKRIDCWNSWHSAGGISLF